MSALREQDDDWDDPEEDWETTDGGDVGDEDGWDEPGVRACPRCAEMISEDAQKCPHCGDWILDEDDSPAVQRSRGVLWPIIIGMLVVALIWMLWR